MIKFIEAINTITNKKIKREDSRPLFSHVQLLNIFMYYLNYIMYFRALIDYFFKLILVKIIL